MKNTLYRIKYHYGRFLPLKKPVDVSMELSSFCNMRCKYCYHTDQDGLPFKTDYMEFDLAINILNQIADEKIPSVKFNWRGESSLNPDYVKILHHAANLFDTQGYPFDRLINSNFMFVKNRHAILDAMGRQTKVKVSFDSFIPEVYEHQRSWGIHKHVLRNIDDFYSKGSNAKLVIQAVRTKLNQDEDIAGQIKERWPDAGISIRDVVAGRNEVDTSEFIDDTRVGKERIPCRQAFVRLIVAHNGQVSPCCPDIKQELILGNATNNLLVDIFNNEKSNALRASLLDKSAFGFDPCKNCSSHESFAGYKPKWGS